MIENYKLFSEFKLFILPRTFVRIRHHHSWILMTQIPTNLAEIWPVQRNPAVLCQISGKLHGI
jgi:hypothetical protein